VTSASKRILFGIAAILSGLIGLVSALNIAYNLGGLLGMQDVASGTKAETALAVGIFAGLGALAFFISYKCIRTALAS
jgi:hypothetical protein